MNNLITNRFNEKIEKKIKYVKKYNTEFNINYEFICEGWDEYIKKEYTIINYNTPIYNLDLPINKKTLQLVKDDNLLAIMLQDIFDFHLYNIEDLIIFFIKGEKKFMIKMKSYDTLNKYNIFDLPYYTFYSDSEYLFNKLNEILNNDNFELNDNDPKLIIFAY